MNFALTAEHATLRSEVRRFLAERVDVRAQIALPGAHDAGLWKDMAAAGWLGVTIPETYGGQDLGLVDLVVVLEETGRALLPGPFLGTVLAAIAIDRRGSVDQRARLLPGIAAGDAIGAYGSDESVACGSIASLVVDGSRIISTFDAAEAGGIDLTRPRSRITVRDAEPLAEHGSDAITIAAAADAMGAAAGALDMAVAYAKEREQFGKPIGAFQAIKHKCADMLRAVETARLAVLYAAAASDEGATDVATAAATAKALASDALMLCATENIQIHGGIGFTFEHDAHLFYRRALSTHADLGSPDEHRDAAARALVDGVAFAERG